MIEVLDKNVSLSPIAILFDWDGVLADTKDLIKDAYLNVFREIGKEPISIDTLHQLPGTSLRDYFPQIFGSQAAQAEVIFYRYVHANHLTRLRQTEGAQQLLEFLQAHHMAMAVISNKRGDILRKEIKHFGWEHFFFEVVGSKDCTEDKPSAVPVHHILSRKNIATPNEHVWLVGDWTADLECAYRAGITPVLINNPDLKRTKTMPFLPKIYAETCLDLKNFLNQCMRKDNETKISGKNDNR